MSQAECHTHCEAQGAAQGLPALSRASGPNRLHRKHWSPGCCVSGEAPAWSAPWVLGWECRLRVGWEKGVGGGRVNLDTGPWPPSGFAGRPPGLGTCCHGNWPSVSIWAESSLWKQSTYQKGSHPRLWVWQLAQFRANPAVSPLSPPPDAPQLPVFSAPVFRKPRAGVTKCVRLDRFEEVGWGAGRTVDPASPRQRRSNSIKNNAL